MKYSVLTFLILAVTASFSQTQTPENLPSYDQYAIAFKGDWLIDPSGANTQLYRTAGGKLVLSNGLVARTFTLQPNGATVGLDHLVTNQAFLRSVRPEAQVTIDGIAMDIGGLTGQPIHNYLKPEWIDSLHADPSAMLFTGYKLSEIKERFPWKKRLEWMPKDLPWPPPGKELTMSYRLNKNALGLLIANTFSDQSRPVLFADDFSRTGNGWNIFASEADERNSFINEGKPGEIMALANTAVFADMEIPEGAEVFLVRLNPGTDLSVSWGPGMGLVFPDGTVRKINLRTKYNEFCFFDGALNINVSGMQEGRSVWLKLETRNDKLFASYSYDKENWTGIGKVAVDEMPVLLRVGKTDWQGKDSDHQDKGKRGRCRIEEVQILGAVPEAVKSNSIERFSYLTDITVKVHYELYDGLPLFCKWITVDNHSDQTIKIDSFTSEILATAEPRNEPTYQHQWMLPNITVQTDHDCGGGMRYELGEHKTYNWEKDPLYKTQVDYGRNMRCLLVVKPQYGPAQTVEPDSTFAGYRVWELLHSTRERERKGLEIRHMFRAIAPWVTENPVMMHARFADTKSVKHVIDQCAEVGFEKVILTFGSGFNIEDTTAENIGRMKMLAGYAHSKGVTLGGYSLLASRSVGGGNDVVMPPGMHPTFGHSPCLCSAWGEEYFEKLYNFFRETGFDNLEHDGSYPGDVCMSTQHPGHTGLEDSRWNQFVTIQKFYHWCKAKGIFLNVPDWYFLNGSNKTGMGYRETNWSLPRKQQEIIERQNIYDGTWVKTPSMGWMHVPLTQYHGGGEAAVYEPLHEHLADYRQRLANLFGSGVQAAWRGNELYDTDTTKQIVKKWVDFYKTHRAVLDGDIIHIRRPDGRDYDAILHVNPQGDEKGLLMVYNPLSDTIRREIDINIYYTGLKDKVEITTQNGEKKIMEADRNYNIPIKMEIPPHSQEWFVIRDAD